MTLKIFSGHFRIVYEGDKNAESISWYGSRNNLYTQTPCRTVLGQRLLFLISINDTSQY